MPPNDNSRSLISWYRDRLRPLISRHLPDREGEWGQEADRIDQLLRGTQDILPVCFLGASGVGKSTLINAMVAGKEIVLPTTGVGPLTAQAIVVRYGEETSFEVEYHPSAQIAKILFPLEQSWKREQHLVAATDYQSPVEDLLTAEDVEKFHVMASEPDSVPGDTSHLRLDILRSQARQLITGKQDEQVELPYVLDGLREILGRPRVWGTTLRPQSEDVDRVRRLQEALVFAQEGKKYRRSGDGVNDGFKKELKDHASGFLAPLIRRIEVTWESSLLAAGLTLIDLPGVGASGDSFKEVTSEYIPHARAVVLVVNRSGIDEASADLLRTSGFLNRLMYAGDRLYEDPVQLVVTAVQIDNVADERFAEDDSREKDVYFQEVQAEMREQLRNQLREQLQTVWRMGEEPFTEREKQVIAQLVSGMEIHPVSAVQHRRFLAARSNDPAFIKELDQSGIQEMQESLKRLAGQLYEQRHQDARRRLDSFIERVVSRFEEFRPPPQQHQRKVIALEARQEFLAYTLQKRDEYLRREGQLRALWTEGVRRQIEAEVEKGSRTAERRILGYLGQLAATKVSVKTLQAVVRRGGRFAGSTREIDLPLDLSLGFDAVMAEVWNDPILRDLRNQTTKFAEDCASLIEEIVAWAKDRELTDLLQPLEAHARAIRADAEQLRMVGEESTAQIRKEIRDRLIAEIETPIAHRCRAFNTSGLGEGAGTKKRILEMFGELAHDVIESSRKIAIQLMARCVEAVRECVSAVWKNRDPLASAVKLGQTAPPPQKPTEEDGRAERDWNEIEETLDDRPDNESKDE